MSPSSADCSDFDDLLCRHVGATGRYQALSTLACFVICVLVIAIPWNHQMLLVAAPMDYRCADDAMNVTTLQSEQATTRDQCVRLADGKPCLNFHFRSAYFHSTMVSEFALVCSRAYLASLYKSAVLIGVFFGLLTWGPLGDHFGRRTIVLAAALLSLATSLVAALTRSFALAVVMRALFGFALTGAHKGMLVMLAEVVSPKSRNVINVIMASIFPVACVIIAAAAQVTRDYHRLQLYAFLTSLAALPILMLLPESPRWLITRERYQEARRTLERAAIINGRRLDAAVALKPIHDAHVSQADESARATASTLTLFRDSTLRRRTVGMCLQWATAAFTYFGVMINSTSGALFSPFTMMYATSAARLVLAPVVTVVMNRFGKKRPLLVVWISAGAALVALAALPQQDSPSPVLALAISVFSATLFDMAFTLCYTFTAELYPTVVRTSGLCLCSSAARVGGVGGMFGADLLGAVWGPLPTVAFASACLIATLALVAFVPDINARRLPDTLTDTRHGDISTEDVGTTSTRLLKHAETGE